MQFWQEMVDFRFFFKSETSEKILKLCIFQKSDREDHQSIKKIINGVACVAWIYKYFFFVFGE